MSAPAAVLFFLMPTSLSSAAYFSLALILGFTWTKKRASNSAGWTKPCPERTLFFIYLGCLAAVFLLRQFFSWYQLRAKDPQRKML